MIDKRGQADCLFSFYRIEKFVLYDKTNKTLREDAHFAHGKLVAGARMCRRHIHYFGWERIVYGTENGRVCNY